MPRDSHGGNAPESTMRRVVDVLLRLLAPMLPHTTDEAWRALEGEDACLAMETMPSPFSVEVHPEWPKVMALRNDVLSALEQAKERGGERHGRGGHLARPRWLAGPLCR